MNEATMRTDLEKDGYSKEEEYFHKLNEKLKLAFKEKQVKWCANKHETGLKVESKSRSQEQKSYRIQDGYCAEAAEVKECHV